MAQYKVPQDVEADDKLIGPFSFRQFVYLLIAAGLVALAVGLYQVFPLLAIIPVPMILLLVVLALPIKKDQPMETYLAALVSFYLKPRVRLWRAGQREATIMITAPKIVEEKRVRDITSEEATNRLSFLTQIVDTGGYAIKGSGQTSVRDDLLAEASVASDMFDSYRANSLGLAAEQQRSRRHEQAVQNMKEVIDDVNNINASASVQKRGEELRGTTTKKQREDFGDVFANVDESVIVKPVPQSEPRTNVAEARQPSEEGEAKRDESRRVSSNLEPESHGEQFEQFKPQEEQLEEIRPILPVEEVEREGADELFREIPKEEDDVDPEMKNLAESGYDIATMAKEAKRIKRRKGEEVFISLH